MSAVGLAGASALVLNVPILAVSKGAGLKDAGFKCAGAKPSGSKL